MVALSLLSVVARPRGVLAGIKAAANGHIAATEHDGMSAVIDGIGTDVNRSRAAMTGAVPFSAHWSQWSHQWQHDRHRFSGTEVVQGLGFRTVSVPLMVPRLVNV